MAHTQIAPDIPKFSKRDLARLYHRRFGDDATGPERALIAAISDAGNNGFLSRKEVSYLNGILVMMQELFDPIMERRVLEPEYFADPPAPTAN